MASGIATIHVRKSKGMMAVQGDGRTPRGQKYIKETIELTVKSTADPRFKAEMATAVEKLLG